MLTLDARQFADLIHSLIQADQVASAQAGPIPETLYGQVQAAADDLSGFCEKLELTVAADAARGLPQAKTFEALRDAVALTRNTLYLQMNRRKYYGPEARYLPYYDDPKLFGDAIFNAFPSANEDITEAGTCLALDRSTACVMHLMRAIEVALQALAKAVNVPTQNDWGTYLRKIDAELEARKKAAGARSADEQFYAEVAIQFDNVRRAWRNPTMHVEKSYSTDRAEEILRAVRAFMSHLATMISE